MFIFNNKAIGPVIVSGLLLVVAIVSVVTFQTWFNSYSAEIFSGVETQSGDSVSSSNIDSIIDGNLYFKNSGTQNITISSIKVGSVDCNVSQSIAPGVSSINVSSCVNGTSGSNEVVVITNQKVFSKKLYLTNQVTSSSNESEEEVVDEYFNYVVLLIQSETSDSSTVFSDSSNISNNIGVNGDVKHNTTIAKFGSSSIYFDGLGDFLNITDSNDLDFGTTNFTIEYWAYLNSVKGEDSSNMRVRNVFIDKNGYYSTGGWLLANAGCGGTTEDSLLVYHNSVIGSCPVKSVDDYLLKNQWYHIALNRYNNNLSLYVDGTRISSTTSSIDYTNIDEIVIGASANPSIRPSINRDLHGHMEEIRITKGISRYNDEFIVPTSPFPTSN